MKCFKCGALLTSETAITTAEIKSKPGKTDEDTDIDVQVKCEKCGAIHYTFLEEKDLFLAD